MNKNESFTVSLQSEKVTVIDYIMKRKFYFDKKDVQVSFNTEIFVCSAKCVCAESFIYLFLKS